MRPIDRPPQWVGRRHELAAFRAAIDALGRGEGAVVWVEGEPGIGKSSLVARAWLPWRTWAGTSAGGQQASLGSACHSA